MTKSLHKRLPDFIIIGAMKAGTSSLFAYLNTHPGISGCAEKEPGYFSDQKWEKGLSWYQELFPDNNDLKFEASTSYAKYPRFDDVPARMHELLPDVKLIYIVRDPVDRVVSQLHHSIVRGYLNDQYDYNSPMFWNDVGAQMINVSKYNLQYTQYLKYYDPRTIFVLKFEDLITRTSETLNNVLGFLGLDNAFFRADGDFRRHNAHSFITRVRHKRLHANLRAIGTRIGIHALYRILESPVPKPKLSLEIRRLMWDQIEGDLMQFQTNLNRDLGYHAPV